MANKTGNIIFTFVRPHPFTVPFTEDRNQQFDDPFLQLLAPFLPADIFLHDQLHYSGPAIENALFMLSIESQNRGQGVILWKAYKTGEDDFDIFAARGFEDGRNRESTLENYPLKFFPLYIRDMQLVIEGFVADSRWPDDIGSAMVRIFGVNTTHVQNWNDVNRIPAEMTVPATDWATDNTNKTAVLTPIDNMAASLFPFPWDSPEVYKPGLQQGIDLRGKAFVNRDGRAFRVFDTEWPRSVIGKRRIEEGQRIVQGFVKDDKQFETDGIDGVHMPMREEGRQTQNRQQISTNSLINAQSNFHSGYGQMAHHPLVLHQCRFQPPMVEAWENKTDVRDYVENVFSNFTPNLPWYFSQPVERQHEGDWGGWIIQGFGGLTNPGLLIRAYPDPQFDNLFTQCLFPAFFPPAEVPCNCGGSNTAYAIWTSRLESLTWNLREWFNFKPEADGKLFGPKTRLRLAGRIRVEAGVGGGGSFAVGIRTIRISTNNLQPFTTILSIGPGEATSLDVNIMEKLAAAIPGYQVGGIDQILSMIISVNSNSSAGGFFPTVNTPTGTVAPNIDLGCAIGTSEADLDYIQLYEPPFEGRNDVRFPEYRELPNTPPPDYNLPIVTQTS